MAQLRPAPFLPAEPPVTPLLLSDRLIGLAQQAEQAGCLATARRLVHLACTVLDEKRGRAPVAPS